jgi:hypothetical protein
LQIKTNIVSSDTADSKPVKQEVNGTVILPPLVFPGTFIIFTNLQEFLKRKCQLSITTLTIKTLRVKTLRMAIKNVTLSITTLSTWCFGVNMQSNVFVQCLLCCLLRFYSYSEYRYTDCFDAKCRYAECYNTKYSYSECHSTKYSYSECHSTECRYAECHSTECHCAVNCLIEPVVPSKLSLLLKIQKHYNYFLG